MTKNDFEVQGVTVGRDESATPTFVKFDCKDDYEIGVRPASIDAYRALEVGSRRELTLYLRSGDNVKLDFVRQPPADPADGDGWTQWDFATDALFAAGGSERLP